MLGVCCVLWFSWVGQRGAEGGRREYWMLDRTVMGGRVVAMVYNPAVALLGSWA